jgi:hypothetical protein
MFFFCLLVGCVMNSNHIRRRELFCCVLATICVHRKWWKPLQSWHEKQRIRQRDESRWIVLHLRFLLEPLRLENVFVLVVLFTVQILSRVC